MQPSCFPITWNHYLTSMSWAGAGWHYPKAEAVQMSERMIFSCQKIGKLHPQMMLRVSISNMWKHEPRRTCTEHGFPHSHLSPKTTLSSVQSSRSVMSDSLRPHESQHARPPCPSPTPRVYSKSCPSSWWCHPAISSSVVPFSSCPQSLPASGSFPVSQLFAWGGQSTGVSASASVLPMNTQDWSL